ncbi:ABC transporter substrate-binding protein [Curtobacterium pusillum]|uniref:ABC transporter substrate-binding protein n=1 Tax=Curtobacterium pusillum TaxID=69373 RepID=UPI0011A130A8|nr:ABC transporter substrate-binding protein [Curtobacterium pusillum]
MTVDLTSRRRRLKRLALAATAAALALTLAACSSGGSATSGSSSGAGVYKLGLQEPDSTINPLTTSDYNAMFLVGLASEGLLSQDAKGTLEGRLAKSWKPSSDGKTWTVTLRDGLQFSDGTALTSKDVVATFDSIIGKDSQSPGKSSFDGILSSVTADGDSAVTFALAKPYADFPYLLTGSNTTIQPAGFSASTNWAKKPVGAGQFVLSKYSAGQGVTFTKNPKYWDAKDVKLSEVDVKFYADDQAQLLAFQSGEIDQIASSPTATATLKGTAVKETKPYYNKFDGIFIDVTKAPFDDPKVREAFALALDRKAIVKTVYGGDASVGNDTTFFPSSAIQPKGLEQRSQDESKVKELLGGKTVSFTITTLDAEKALAQVVQQQLEAVGGFKVTLKVLTSAEYYADGDDTPWLNAPVTITNWAQRLPAQYVDLIYRSGAAWNASKYSNPELEKFVDQYESTTSDSERQDLANQIATIEWTDLPVIVPAFASSKILLQEHVTGTFRSGQDFPGGFDFRGIGVSSS